MASYLVRPGGGVRPFSLQSVTTGATLDPGACGQVRTALGAVTVLLPSSAGDGGACAVSDVDGLASTNPITVDGNGRLIDGAATTTVDIAGGDAVFVLDGGAWRRVLPSRVFESTSDGAEVRCVDLPAGGSAAAALRGVCTLEQYGGVGSDPVLDKAAWNFAMAALASVGGPRALAITPGKTFLIQDGDPIPEGVRVFGYGDESILSTTLDAPLVVVGGERVKLENLMLQGSCLGGPGGDYSNDDQIGLTVGVPDVALSGFFHFQATNVHFNGFAKGTILGPADADEPAIGPIFTACRWSHNFVTAVEVQKQYVTFNGCGIEGNFSHGPDEIGLHIRAGNVSWIGGVITQLHHNVKISPNYNDGHGLITGALITHSLVCAITVENIINGFEFVGCSIVADSVGIELAGCTGVRFIGCRIFAFECVHNDSIGTLYDSNRWVYPTVFSGNQIPPFVGSNMTMEGAAFTPAIDPSEYVLSAYWKPDYAGAPFAGTASAGDSVGHYLSAGAPSPAPAASVNGLIGADYVAASSTYLSSSDLVASLADLIGAGDPVSCGGAILFYPRTATADAGAGSRRNNPAFFQDVNAILNLGFSSAGAQIAATNASGVRKEIAIACGLSAWRQLFWKISANVIYLKLDDGEWESLALADDLSPSRSTTVFFGWSFSGSTYLDGVVQENLLFKTAPPTDAQVASLSTWWRGKYPAMSLITV